jgi:peroxiredoxin
MNPRPRRGRTLIACACAFAGACASEGAAPNAATGARAPDFAARDVQGRTVRLADYLGKRVVLLDFFATYCEPCLAEMPHLESIYESERANGLVVLGVAMDGPETEAEVPSFVRRNGIAFPVVLDDDSHVAGLYNPKKSAPLAVLIDRHGDVVRVREGYNPGDERLVADDVRAATGSHD